MWSANIKSFLKHLYNNKVYTVVTIFGFAVSLAFVILLSVYVKNELSVNSEQKNSNLIYRMRYEDGSTYAPPVGGWIQDKFPEVQSYTRIYEENEIINSKGADEKYKADLLFADSTFFDIFTFRLIEGNKDDVLKTANSIVLTKETARKLFGDKSPIGKEILINMEIPVTVTGVIEDISKKSFFKKVDGIINFRALKNIWGWDELLTSTGNCSFNIYFMAKPNTNLPAKAPQVLDILKKDLWLYRDGIAKSVVFEPLEDVYFSPVDGLGIKQNSKIKVTILSVIVILILLLAVINYLNLTIAHAGMRVKETAIKKIHGTTRRQLIIQYLLETLLLFFTAFLIALLLTYSLEPTFNDLLKTNLHLSNNLTGINFSIFILFILLISIVSGVVPALIITKFKAVDIIKGRFSYKAKTTYSKALISFQYLVVIILIISSITIKKQTSFLTHKNPGYNTKNIVMLDCNIETSQKQALKNEFLKIPGIKDVSYVAGTPVDGGNNNTFNYKNRSVSFQVFLVDSAFFRMMDIKTTPTGAALSKNGIWLNRTAVRILEIDSLPKSFEFNGETVPVTGVVDDFHFRSLHKKIGMLAIKQMHKDDYPWNILVQIDSKNIPGTMEKLKKTYLSFTGGIPSDYLFLDNAIQSWYTKEGRTSKIVTYFALLAIIISVMGIFAMSVFFNQQRTKEIGIRRVNGATVSEIIKMLNIDLLKWVILAFIIAVPVGYYAMSQWLNNFAYQIELNLWIFLLAGIIAILVAFITVSWQTFSTARRNPVEALRYE